MGRLFVTNLEEPVYRCKKCQVVEIADYNPKIKIKHTFRHSGKVGTLYCFLKCFNVVIGTHKGTLTINNKIYNSMFEVYCIACGSLVGLCYKSADDTGMYNEGKFFIHRFKLHGPPGESDDDENP